MYYIYALVLYLFVLFISVFVLRLLSISTSQSREYIILPLTADMDIKTVEKRIKEIYYEESLAGKNGSRRLILADIRQRDDIARLCNDLDMADYVLYSELEDYLRKKDRIG
jgi:hypothetical protein